MPCPQPDDPAPSGAPITPDTATICVRCKANPATAFFRDSIYCQPCALAVFYQKSKTGLEYARGAGLAKYVAAAKASTATESSQEASSSTSTPQAAKGDKSNGKQVNNGGGNAEVNVSANIAVAFSGGIGSRALLRTATQYFRPEAAFTNRDARRRKARGEDIDDNDAASVTSAKSRSAASAAGRFNEVGKIYVLYIDDSAIIEGGVDRTEEARRMVEEEGCVDLEFVGLKLEDVFRADDDEIEGVPWMLASEDGQQISTSTSAIPDSKQALKDLFSSLHPSDTPRTGASSARTRIEDLHRILISTLLRRTATHLDCSALLLGDTATRISIRLIEDLAKGAGHKLPIQGSDAAWIDDLLLVRPFKSHLLQEVLFYTSALGLDAIQPEQNVVPPIVSMSDILNNSSSGATPVMDKTSIARLTETFILNLEKGVPSTVTTIGKTGSKLVLNEPASPSPVQDVASSTATFQTVGPSVPLRPTARKALHTGMSDLSLSREPRIGSRGIKLAQLSASCLRWITGSGCALCGMPRQKGARWWKRDITISRLGETEPSDATRGTSSGEAEEGWRDLSAHLCYACLLVLAPPTLTSGSLLPSSVLRHIQQSNLSANKTHADGSGISSVLDQDTHETPAEPSACGNHNQPKPTPQPLKPSEIKAQINEFLLDDA
ncbi:Cytoplasmic tRNA 2-thiolation protein 2 [Pseudozyma hubeiensis]|nr:Cytoplasmic tRNA 2-thiolation protein 2 [Pseudozyma hubeiensis]